MCTDCHSQAPHEDDRINTHLASVACQTCHVPAGGTGDPTKMTWDWSTAGQDRPEDEHEYLKIKGSFFYEERLHAGVLTGTTASPIAISWEIRLIQVSRST